MSSKFNRDKNIAEQIVAIRRKYIGFEVAYNHFQLRATGEIQPTARSGKYLVEIKYHLRSAPEIKVLKPTLVIHSNGDKIPHTYPGDRLCLYRPKYGEFKYSDNISDTIIPWTALWLYHYEVWHVTGLWKGGGEHPTTTNKKHEKKRKTHR